jgi:Ca2+-binding RTX toxin-like protein
MGADGADKMDGGAGNDHLVGSAGDDRITGGPGGEPWMVASATISVALRRA